MKPLQHLKYSTAAATVLFFTNRNSKIAIGCLASGVLVDLDHLIEYKNYCHNNWEWEEFLTGSYFDKKRTVKIVFHSWEIAAIVWGIVFATGGIRKKSLLYGVAVGYTLHLLLDQIGNNLNCLGYFEIYRWFVRWQQDMLISHDYLV